MPRRHSFSPRIKVEQLNSPPSPFKTILPDNNEIRLDVNGVEDTMEVSKSDLDTSRYRHKKFKKVATLEEISPPNGKLEEELRSESPGGRYVCPYCKLACAKPSVLQKHIRAHTNERPYPCHPCGFAFKTKSNLYKHCRSRAHTLKMDITDFSAEPSSDEDDKGEASQPAKKIYKPKFHTLGDQDDSSESLGSNPDVLQMRISKLISENQAIVDPGRKTESSFPSKLALALLRPNKSVSPEPIEPQPLNLSQKQAADKSYPIDGSIIKDILLKSRTSINGISQRDEKVKCSNCHLSVDKLDLHLRICKGQLSKPSGGPLLGKTPLIDPSDNNNTKRRKISSPLRVRLYEETITSPQKSVRLFGGEVQILDSPGGETRTLRIDSGQDQSPVFIDSQCIAKRGEQKDSQVLTIAKAGLHSVGRTMIQTESPSPSMFAGKLVIPLPSTPSISLPGVSSIPYPPALNPLTSITAFNPLTLPNPNPSSGLTTIVHGGKAIPHVPGMPGPNSLLNSSLIPSKFEKSVIVNGSVTSPIGESHKSESIAPKSVPSIQLQLEDQYLKISKSSFDSLQYAQQKDLQLLQVRTESLEKKFVRPTSLPLKQGTYVAKKHAPAPAALISPETPRPRKSYGQLYLNGHAYTYLGLKCSTRMFFCTLNKPQPIYVPLTPEHSKLSMYSNWKVCSESVLSPAGMSPSSAMSSYDSRNRSSCNTQANRNNQDLITHSSYKSQNIVISPDIQKKDSPVDENEKKRVKVCDGGYESNEDYVYVRGRGRGRYVCEECGIRCKKPSMLKKHIRTHTDVRPYTCKYCAFSFKTKGNLTKHMKSKSHYKRCVELDISPVPTVVDDSNIDKECLAKQEALRAEGVVGSSEESEEEEEDSEDDDEETEDEEEGKMEREAAASLLSLSKVAIKSALEDYAKLGLLCSSLRPTTYPYTYIPKGDNSKQLSPFMDGGGTSPHPLELRVSKSPLSSDSTIPIDLSNKSSDGVVNEQASLLATIVSSTERLAGTPASSVSTPVCDAEENTLLHTYLKEKAARETQIKQQQYAENRVLKEISEEDTVNHPAKESALGILALTSSHAAKSPSLLPPQSKLKAEFMPPSNSPNYVNVVEDGKSVCGICNKVFSKPSHLRLHVNIHYFERPFKCEACAVSFRTKGHLQKHQRSLSHLNKVNMNSTFGTATTTNPRPFKCDDCKIAFRIHGHLAKHLRSKMHIMRLECLGKLPFGMYAELERSGLNMNDIDTTDCENSLESLQLLAQRLHEKDPSKLGQWAPPEGTVAPQLNMMSCGETSSDEDEPRNSNTQVNALPDDTRSARAS